MDNLTIKMFSEQAEYDCAGFNSGDDVLDDFLRNRLASQHGGRVLRGYLLLTKDPVPQVMGFYTLSGSSFERATLPSNTQQRKVPYTNVPSVTLGRLAVHKDLQGQGYGSILVAHALKVVYQASRAVGIYGVFVDALNPGAQQFYQQFGFIRLKGENANSLFYPTKSIEQLFDAE